MRMGELVYAFIPMEKIVIGKPVTTSDAYNTGYMQPYELSLSLAAAYRHNKWHTGVMFWQFSSDPNSTVLEKSLNGLLA